MKRSLLALTLLAALPFAASAAEGVSYSYVEGGYRATDTDFGGADGFAVKRSGARAPNSPVCGAYPRQTTDDFTDLGIRFRGVDVDQYRAGVGYNHEISPRMDLLSRVAYERTEVESEDLDGYSVEAGGRGALSPMIEGYALTGYEDGSDFDGDFYGRVGGQVNFNPTWGLSGDVKFADGDTQYFIGPRITS